MAGFFYALYTKTDFCCLLDMKFNINVPESLNDITLGQYQKYLKIEEPTDEDLLKCFMNLNLDGIGKMKGKDVTKLTTHINSLFEQTPKQKRTFDLNGIKYGFIPDLDNITYGENKDVTTYISDWENMNKAMTVLYRPITLDKKPKYLIEEYKGTRERCELMKKMPLGEAMGALLFFWTLTNDLLKHIPNYLQKQSKELQTQGQLSEENGEAIRKLTYSLKVRLEELLEFPKILRSQSTHSIAV